MKRLSRLSRLSRLFTVILFLLLFAFTRPVFASFDAATDGGNNAGLTTTLTWNHTTGSISNGIGWVCFAGDLVTGGNDDISSVTWDSVGMTLGKKNDTVAGGARFTYCYYLINPPSGAKAILITAGSSHYLLGGSVTYSSAKQSGIPDASAINTAAGTGTANLTTSVTTVADNSWTLLFSWGGNGVSAPSAGTGSTARISGVALPYWTIFDSNGAITPAGSTSMQSTILTAGNTNTQTHNMVSFAPYVSSGTRCPITTLGVGRC